MSIEGGLYSHLSTISGSTAAKRVFPIDPLEMRSKDDPNYVLNISLILRRFPDRLAAFTESTKDLREG